MSNELTINKIALEKLNRFLNPNFETKFISTLLVAGIALLGYQRVLQLASSLEVFSGDVYVKLALSSSTDIIFVIIGALMVITSCFLFWLRGERSRESSVKKYKTLYDASLEIRPIMDENRRVFINFGPNSDSGSSGALRHDFEVWERLKIEQIIPNNEKILGILNHTFRFKKDELSPVERIKSHIQAFETHCENPNQDYSEHQFPLEFADLINKYSSEKSKALNNIETYRSWIIENISEVKLKPLKIYLYGSALYGQEATDVDMIMKTSATQVNQIKDDAKVCQLLSEDFKKQFGLHLHLKVFSELEAEAYKRYFGKVPAVERIY